MSEYAITRHHNMYHIMYSISSKGLEIFLCYIEYSVKEAFEYKSTKKYNNI